MNKKGFISTAVIYSFFLVFIAIVIGIVVSYSNRRILLSAIKDDARNTLDKFVTYDCLSQGIKYLNECIIYQNGGDDVAKLGINTHATLDEIPGLYYDQLWDTYFFRGNVKNNYVQFGILEQGLYKGYQLKKNADDTITRNGEMIDYTSKEACEEDFNPNKNTYTITNVCYEVYKPGDKMYWRIVNIDTYDDIKLIYEGTSIIEDTSNSSNNNNSMFPNINDLMNIITNLINSIMTQNDVKKGYVKSDYKTYNEVLTNWYNINIGEYYDYYTDYKSPTLLTVEEAIAAGAIYEEESEAKFPTYLNTLSFHLKDKVDTRNNYALNTSGKIFVENSSAQYNLRPVIILENYVKIKNGDGTSENPFVLEEVGY